MVLLAGAVMVACETPPSKYIPPREQREIPNIDPPPGIPNMAASAKPSPSAATSALPLTIDAGAKPPKKRRPR